jgi:hypothetical protein
VGETLIRLLEETRTPGICRGCDARLDWYQTLNDKAMPMNAGAVPRKSEHDDQRRTVAYFSADDSHWNSCPEMQRFKRRR